MKFRHLLPHRPLLALMFAAVLAQPALAAKPAEGRPAPPFKATALDGRAVDAASVRGKVVMLHFWATWCGPCREEMPALEAFYREHRKEGFELVAVSLEDTEDEAQVREFARGFSYPVAMRGGADVDAYGRIRHLPVSFVIDRQGILRKSYWTGDTKIDAASLDKFVAPLLRE